MCVRGRDADGGSKVSESVVENDSLQEQCVGPIRRFNHWLLGQPSPTSEI